MALLIGLLACFGLSEFCRRYVDAWMQVCHALGMSSSDSLPDVLDEIDRLKRRTVEDE